ncbi:fibronectin type III domain-containing protein [uncultured Enterococcus sp.]|uniref:fibronectin type III domain-containing protein n=1 Tax=uncultured Enterococcus sp. TaxID=167972 RepID=UPI002AA8547C|nr:fibronectin type III domain-containing protein [uncultured Enterococcus sp.]
MVLRLLPESPRNLSVRDINKSGATFEWSGGSGDIVSNELIIAKGVSSPYTADELKSNTEYTVKVVNFGGESNTVAFKTKEITYKEVTIICDFVNKTYDSLLENSNVAKMQASTNLLLPDASNFYELDQSRYNGIMEMNDGKLYSVTNTTKNNRLQVVLYYNVVEAIKQFDSNYFFEKGANTDEEKAAMVNQEVLSAESNVYGFGSALDSTAFRTAVFIDNGWGNKTVTNGIEIQRNAISMDGISIGTDGLLPVLVYADTSGGTTETASALRIDHANLELKILQEED